MAKDLIFKSLYNTLLQYNKILIVSHTNPDGDAIGSSLGLYLFLKKLGLEPKVMVPNDYPIFLSWMPAVEDIIVFDKDVEKAVAYMRESELFCYLDFNSESRTGMMHNDLCHFKDTPRLLIDHHLEADEDYFEACLSETNVSSTSELVAELIQYQDYNKYMDSDIATNLLVGIITDTGSFAHSVYENTFSICNKLLSYSLDYRTIHQKIFNTFSENRLRLLGFLINERMVVLDEYKVAYIYVKKEDLDAFDYQVGDTEGVVNYPLSMDKINMSVLITERQGMIRFSFRSKGDFSVNDLARKYFNGGGHLNAAGGTLICTLDKAIERLLLVLPEYKEQLNK